MALFTLIGVAAVYCWLHVLIFGGNFKLSLNNPMPKIKKLFSK